MAKEKTDRIKHIYIVISIVGILSAVGWKGYCHFAKTSVVEVIAKAGIAGREAAAKTFKLVQQQFHIIASDSDVARQEGNLQRARNNIRYKRNDEPPTAAEEEYVQKEEKELKRVVKKRDELVEQYKSEK